MDSRRGLLSGSGMLWTSVGAYPIWMAAGLLADGPSAFDSSTQIDFSQIAEDHAFRGMFSLDRDQTLVHS